MFLFRFFKRAIALVLLIAIAVPGYAVGKTWYDAHFPTSRSGDVIVVLGAAQLNGTPGEVLEARLSEALRLYRAKFAPLIITVGSKQPGDRTTEAASGKAWLIRKGVPRNRIIAVAEGRDTFVSTKSYVEVMKQRGINNVIIATDPYHCARAMTMANDLGVVATCSPVTTGPNTLSSSGYRYLIREAGAYLAYISLGRRGVHISDHLPATTPLSISPYQANAIGYALKWEHGL